MVGGDEVEVQDGSTQTEIPARQLTEEDIREIKEKVDEKESADAIVVLLSKMVDNIMMEEFFVTNRKMNEFRRVLAKGVLLMAEKHTEDRAKLDFFVDAFRAAWKVYKDGGDDATTMDVFMKEMNNELWFNEEYPLRSEDTEA